MISFTFELKLYNMNKIKNDLIVLDAREFGIEPSKAKQIEATFVPMVNLLKGFESDYNDILQDKEITEELGKRAKRLRLDISKVRIETEKIRKREKEEFLRAGKAIDGVANILKYAISGKEEELEKIEKHFETLENERKEKLAISRAKELEGFDVYNMLGLGDMEENVYKNFLVGSKTNFEIKIEAEKKAEADLIAKEKAEREEQERIRKENEKLKAEAIENERLEKIESQKREKAEADRKEKEEKERLEREAKAKKDREQAEAKLKAEREAKEKLEAEIKAKKDTEAKAEKERKELERQNRLAPDKEKLTGWVNEMEIDIPTLKNKDCEKVCDEILFKFQGFRKWAYGEINKLK